MTTKIKVVLVALGTLVIAGTVFVFSQDAKRKRYINTVVPPDYARQLINQQ